MAIGSLIDGDLSELPIMSQAAELGFLNNETDELCDKIYNSLTTNTSDC